MDYSRALSWSRAMAGLFLAKPEDFIQCWEDPRMSKALLVFLLLRRHSRTGLLQDAVSAYDLALQFPIGPHAWSSQRQHYFIDCLLRLLHRVFFRLYGAGGAADGELLGKTTQITRRTVDHSLLENDNRTVFLMERSKALQLWFVRAADVESLCLAIALLHRQLIAAPFKGVECPTCHFWRLAQKYWNIGVSVMSFEISIMDAIIAFFRDVVQRCPAGHHSAQALSEDLVRMLKSRCAVNHDSSLHDEYLLLSMHSLLGPSSAELSTADKCITLSLDMLSRFRDTRNYDQLAHAARLCEAALERCPPDHPSRAAVYHSARSVYSARYEDDGDLSLLRRAIQLQQQAVMHATVDDADRAKMCGSLKYSLYRAFQREGHVSDLEGWVAMAREVLRLCPNRDHDRAGACNELAVALIEVFVKSGLLSAYEEAMERCEEAILCTSPGHPTRARVAENLTNAAVYYSGRKEPQEEGNLGLLRRAVALQQEVLQLNLAPEVQPIERAMTQCNLARTMSALDAYLGGYESEQECIALYRSALSLVPETHRGRSVACSGLLEIFQGRLTRTGELASLDAAICEAREAMRFTYPTDSSYYGIRGALADALRTRFRFFGQSADLDEAISVLRMLLSGMSPTDSNRIIACPSLASSLHMEYQRTGDMSRLEEAISLQQEAYTICPKGRLGRVAVCSDYALFLVDQFRATGNCALLDRAIEFYRETLLLELPGHAERPSCLSNLGACLGQRFKYGGDLASLNEGIQLLREAVELRPPRHAKRGVACSNLATILLVHMLHTKDNSYMEETIYLCEEACGAGDSKMRITSLSSYLCLSSVYCIPGTLFFNPAAAVVALRAATHNIHEASLPVDLIAHLNSLDLDLIPESHMRDMLSIFSSVISCLPRLSNATMTLHTRLRTLKASKNLGAASLHCAVMVGDLKTSVELVEKSRAVFWSQALNMRDPQLENLPNDLRTEIERLLHALSSPPTLLEDSQLTARDVFHRRHEQLQTLIAEVRTLPGLAHFMLGTSYDKLVNVIHDSVVVIFSADKGACRAIILRGANLHPVHLQLDELCADELDELSAPLADLGMRHGSTKNPCGDNERALGISGRQNGGSPMERLLSKLWFKVMKPVLQALDYRTRLDGRERPRIILCPTGQFTFTPLHAAGVFHGSMAAQECVSDYVVCSYVPTLSALQQGRKGVASRHLSDMSFLAIAEGSAYGMSPLHNVDMEVNSVCDSAEKASLRVLTTRTTGTSTIQHAVSSITGADIVHLACHGVQDAKDALQSGFCLGDGRLTVAELMNLKLHSPFLAFLSACETAKGDKTLPDQTVHLAAAMLFCGFQNVIGTMWSMGDEDGPTVARRVYATLFAQESVNAEDVPYALDAAVQELRSAGVSPSRWATFIHLGA